ncbi:sigma-70 family RNA polymerase sigma factor [Parapedobacter sp. 10938]|uniref:sigma-70 family RNA polymerase sigma factor n=1 Tax=Parapedobacter flavus TaxID=3110225 RepID=UPI002DB878B0|nr:sigma-70 family RNA polymerase sigma factor [Parapedobacter sp. 10938]MEC3880010.1 sigma-70 family RNA polymerase sigma factor [Parapedobacter sp. 10938]
MTDYQSKLLPYAYNILGSVDDALDVIQDVMVKRLSGVGATLENESAYLIKSVINRAINLKDRNKRIRGEGTWLPEPMATERADSRLKKKEIISYSMLVLLEHLNARERAVFILKEAFDYAHEEIAETLSITVENSRKLLSRAKRNLKGSDGGFKPAATVTTDFLETYIHCIEAGDIEALTQLLAKEIAVKADGGKNMQVVSELTEGQRPVIDLVLYLYQHYQHRYQVAVQTVNHQPALLFYEDGQLVNCQVFEWDDQQSTIRNIFSIVDPDKLCRISV